MVSGVKYNVQKIGSRLLSLWYKVQGVGYRVKDIRKQFRNKKP
jgi:hypothetical protein